MRGCGDEEVTADISSNGCKAGVTDFLPGRNGTLCVCDQNLCNLEKDLKAAYIGDDDNTKPTQYYDVKHSTPQNVDSKPNEIGGGKKSGKKDGAFTKNSQPKQVDDEKNSTQHENDKTSTLKYVDTMPTTKDDNKNSAKKDVFKMDLLIVLAIAMARFR